MNKLKVDYSCNIYTLACVIFINISIYANKNLDKNVDDKFESLMLSATCVRHDSSPRFRPAEPPVDQIVLLGLLPCYHVYGMFSSVIGAIAGGVKVIYLPRFHPESFFKAIEKYKVRCRRQTITINISIICYFQHIVIQMISHEDQRHVLKTGAHFFHKYD